MPLMLAIALYTSIVVIIEDNWLHLEEDHNLRNIPAMHSLLSFAISMLLVFRTNTAYDRWWEGRKLWGALVNNSRNLAVKINIFLPQDMNNERDIFRRVDSDVCHVFAQAFAI